MTGKVAVLFWFYRDLPVCRNRLDLLRRDNPGRAIYGVYGGPLEDAERFRAALAPGLDDFWVFDRPVSSKWKWRHGDLMLAAWFADRGEQLVWDHVFVAQWDMLVLQPIADLVPPLAPDDVLLSAVLPVAAVEPGWVWSKGGHEPDYRAFLAAMHEQFGAVEPMSCVFVVACLPRRLLAAYAELTDPEAGYVEYRLPTVAVAVGLRLVADERFAAWRPADPTSGASPTRREKYLSGSRRSIRFPTVARELWRRDGARVFHPYHGLFPLDAKWAARAPVWAVYSGARNLRGAISARLARRRGRAISGSRSGA